MLKAIRVLLCSLLAVSSCVRADEPVDARRVIGDLSRIVAPTGVQQSYKLKVGGIDQWLYVRGQDTANPVLLFIHGGPASPNMPSSWIYQRPLEEYFTVVNYDQRGAGRSYLEADPDTVRPTLTIDRYVQDAIAIAEHVRTRFGKRKIILMGHSWGTTVGLQAALARPDLFHAYVGMGQYINSQTNEQVSYDYAVARAKAEGNQAALAELATIAPYPGTMPVTRERIIVARKWAQHYGGLSAYRDSSWYYFNAPELSPDYDAAAVAAIDKGNLLSLGALLPQMLKVNFDAVTRFPIPVFMFLGRHDYSTPSQPVAAWMERLQAPSKQVVWFERSSHLMQYEEPGKLLLSLVQLVRPLARD